MGEEFKQSETPINNKIGKVEKRFEQSKKEKVTLMFKGNRTFELKLGRELTRFEGREKKSFPKSILNHPDFTSNIRKYFSIQEGK